MVRDAYHSDGAESEKGRHLSAVAWGVFGLICLVVHSSPLGRALDCPLW